MSADSPEEFHYGVHQLARRLDAQGLLSEDIFHVWARAWGLAHGAPEEYMDWPRPLWARFREACERLQADQVSVKGRKS